MRALLLAVMALPAMGGEFYLRHVLRTFNTSAGRTNVSISSGQYYVIKASLNSANSRALPYVLITYPEAPDVPLRVTSPAGLSITGPARLDFVGSDSVSGQGVTSFECVFGYNQDQPPLAEIIVERSANLRNWERAVTILDTSTNAFYRLQPPPVAP